MKPVVVLLLLLCSFHSFTQTPQPYNPQIIPLTTPPIVQKLPLDPNRIIMIRATPPLEAAVVIAHRPVVRQEIDRISYDVQADPESKANDALEMLRKVPMVTVDGNDNIQLKGSGNYLIFLNGRPSALMTNAPADVLKSMPAAAVKKIEVITVPPAKYDAEGVIGIINIITLEKTDEGYNATLFGRYNTVFGERGSISFNAKEGEFGFNALLGAAHQPLRTSAGGSALDNFSPASDLSQQGWNVNGADIHNGQAQLSFTADSLDLLNASFDFFNRNFTRNTFRNTQLTTPPDSLVTSYQSDNIGKGSVNAFDAGLSYQRGFLKNKNETLTIAWQYAATTNTQDNTVTAIDRFNYTGNDYSQQNNTSSTQHTLQLDFIKPIRQFSIEAGGAAILTVNTSNSESTPDILLTDRFNYHQNVYSGYNSYQAKAGPWTVKTGLRLENTDISSNQTTHQNYNNLIPAISIQRTDPGIGSFTLGFTDRIQRPGLQQLNPFIDRSNPGFITTGNPDLRPVVNHVIELGFARPGRTPVNISLNYAFADNTIQNVTELLSDTVSETTWSNLGTTKNAGINFSTNYPIGNRLNLNINAQLSHLWITGTYNSQLYHNDGNQGNANLFARYNFDHGFTLNIDFGYQSGNVLLQGKSSHYSFSTYNIIKDVLKKKATVSLTIYSPFREYNNSSSYTHTPDFTQTSYTQFFYRMFRFALNYKFGKLTPSSSDKQPTE